MDQAPITGHPPLFHDDGVIKYHCDWQASPPILDPALADLMAWRDRLYGQGLIGVYPDGVGYGNLSHRHHDQGFFISGTQTGDLPTTTPDHYAWVNQWDIAANYLHCQGPIQASSESLTHAALYEQTNDIQAIVHGHHPQLWQTYQQVLPTTRPEVPYGTPAMAAEMGRLFRESDVATQRVLIMAGHEDGILSFGPTLEAAAQALLALLPVG
ncbi:MAG: class II aldolase/adducin family protein [Cyanobacteria bacterium]|nr:class II aldolase/adducin family protein [Cyanobacteriota bacterium]MDA0866311.1 class II aldolase/adducin family protein [Cyanobacteriota bacterium]